MVARMRALISKNIAANRGTAISISIKFLVAARQLHPEAR
jgi:hypothetical protein